MDTTYEKIARFLNREIGVTSTMITTEAKLANLLRDEEDVADFEFGMQEEFKIEVRLDGNFSHATTLGELADAIDKVKS